MCGIAILKLTDLVIFGFVVMSGLLGECTCPASASLPDSAGSSFFRERRFARSSCAVACPPFLNLALNWPKVTRAHRRGLSSRERGTACSMPCT